MIRSTSCSFALLAAAFAAAAAGAKPAPKPDQLKLGKGVSILSDHLRLALPIGMRLEARERRGPAGNAPLEEETRAALSLGRSRFELLAIERHATVGQSLRAGVEAVLRDPGGWYRASEPIEALAVAPPLEGLGCPQPKEGFEEQNLVYVAFLATADQEVEELRFTVNAAGEKQASAFATLARRIASTAIGGARAKGPRSNEHRFPATAAEQLVVVAPDDWFEATREGPDFVLYELQRATVFGTPAPRLTIYLGGHPSYQHVQQGAAGPVELIDGTLLGGEAKWHLWESRGERVAEAIANVHSEPRAPDLQVHVFGSASTREALAGLRALAESMRLQANAPR